VIGIVYYFKWKELIKLQKVNDLKKVNKKTVKSSRKKSRIVSEKNKKRKIWQTIRSNYIRNRRLYKKKNKNQ
jgi:hypothetical protein